jgi:hypothetical protein
LHAEAILAQRDHMHTDDLAALAKQHASAAVKTLVTALGSSDTEAAVAAAVALLSVGYGQPLQRFAVDAGGIAVEVNAGEPDGAHRGNGKAAGHFPD